MFNITITAFIFSSLHFIHYLDIRYDFSYVLTFTFRTTFTDASSGLTSNGLYLLTYNMNNSINNVYFQIGGIISIGCCVLKSIR